MATPNLVIVSNGSSGPPARSANPNVQMILDSTGANDYDEYTLREHIYTTTDAYTGNDEQVEREVRVLDQTDPNDLKFVKTIVTVPECVERVFLEILSNAGDNAGKSKKLDVDIGKIEILMDKKRISVKNGGLPIPVEINEKTGVYAGEMVVGRLLTSSNYHGDREGAGRNGYGAKLCNIFSHMFTLVIGDPYRKKKYVQQWEKNMTICHPPSIEDGYTGESFVQIIYDLDFERFGYTEYPDETFALFAAHSANMSFTNKVPVYFNNVSMDLRDSIKYVKAVYGEVNNVIAHFEWPEKTQTTRKKVGQSSTKVAKDNEVIPNVEILMVDANEFGKGEIISFVNGMLTRDGGVHTQAAYEIISKKVLAVVNKPAKGENGKKDVDKTKVLNMGNVKRHLSLVFNYHVKNPKYASQQKTKLSFPRPKIKIPESTLTPVLKWNLVDRLKAELREKLFKDMTKSDGRKKRKVNIAKAEDANFAGSNKSKDCTLYLTEGKSAMGYATKMISLVDQGRNTMGVYPMKGKPLNVLNAEMDNPEKIVKNTEIADLKQMLGIREKVDYSLEENFKTLRYGQVVILADSDVDGKHIIGLILLIFNLYPSLLRRGYVIFMRTPVLRVYKGKQMLKFHMQSQYDEWKEQQEAAGNDVSKWEHKYFKGLGSSSNDDIKDDFFDQKLVYCIYDDTTPAYFALVFDKRLSDRRKKWIENHKQVFGLETMEMLGISTFLYSEMIEHSIVNLHRMIPGKDGLKESLRKIIWGSFKKWGAKIGTSGATPLKVGRLAPYVAEATNYHYGEKSLIEAINHAALDYCGTNNLPLFTQDGQFGTRNLDGDDAADGRYTSTRPQFWWPYLFRKEDHSVS